ncbi:MAG: glycerophosphodiester phosphodiesterase [Thermodesulfobacteriota bacterium]|nr:glycerophosphodiester phosphodiesterase [Thermodesulfobacteriota bacterium]
MTDTITIIWKKVFTILRKSAGRIFTTHLAYVALGTLLFTPLVGVVGRFLLRLSGQSMLSDFDIAYFLLTPLGMGALILLGALLITILVFEQASLMAISAGSVQGLHITTMSALYFTARQARRIFLFAIRLVIRVLIIVLPFLAIGGAIAWFLLTDYDINYYLTEKPPVFMVAAAIIGLLLLIMLVLLLRKLLSWSLALPLLLFTNVSPARCFTESESLTVGHKRLFVITLGTWGMAALILGSVVLGSVQLLGSKLAPLFFDSITLLVPVLGGLVALWTLGNLLVTTLTSGSFASLLLALYEHSGAEIMPAGLTGREQGGRMRMTAPRFALLLIGCTAVAVLLGAWLLNGIRTEDNVSVIAHRGAAGKAPENTLASIRQAVKDNTDWVEIDVQETVDGEVVVIHDSDFMKLAGVNMKVWNGSLKELQEIDIGSWFDPKFSTERVPTLADVLEEVRGKARLLIELKYYGHDQQLEQRVVDIVEQAGMVDDVAIMSLKHEGIQKFKVLRPDWSTGLLLTKAIGDLSKLDVDFLAVNTAMATSGFIRRTQSAGKQVYVWTVNDQVSMSRMMSLGVDSIITDEPELARTVQTERSDLNSIERLLIHTAVLLGRPVPQRTYRDQSP